jgi:carboxylesterase type B
VDCIVELPALCTQSAPVSTQNTNDQPTSFAIDQPVGTQVYTGFRDFFVWKFRGIRYAQQPERFSYSTMYEANQTDPILAMKARADCLQPIGEVQSGSSEDCLFLNVWTPYLPPMELNPAAKPTLKPVMLYIYGGGFTSGSGKNPNTDGTMLASRGDVVVVSVNYRVSTLGWLPFDDGVHNGNYGLGDIVTALEWVSKHIAYFGGDPSKVTIFGESAGAMLVRALLASPKAKGLFYAAISQSGPTGLSGNEFGSAAYYNTLKREFSSTTIPILKKTGCFDVADRISCLRNFNATELINLSTVGRYGVFKIVGKLSTTNNL